MSIESLGPILFEGVSAITATPSVEVGTERTVAGEKYIYVYNCGGNTAAVGCGMSRPVSAFAGMYSGSVSAVSGDVIIGYVKHVALPTLNYGWALKRGILGVSVASSASDQAAGNKGVGPLGVGVSTIAAGGFVVGELMTLIVSGNTGTLFVNIP